jgi:sulfur-oxidizing protein SoxY
MLPGEQVKRLLAGAMLAAAGWLWMGASAIGADDSANPDTDIWQKVRADLFGARQVTEDAQAGQVRIDIPARAADAAVVPLSIQVRPRTGEPPPRKVYVVIDRNPSPVAAIFEFGEASGGAQIETRVRIEEYTWVRVIAENADGSLVGARRFVKAAGGCSAPAGKSLAERQAGMGQMKWRIPEASSSIEPRTVQLMIRHPNDSGLAMDQLTRHYDPPDYVRKVRVTRDGVLVLDADVDFSISQNPAFRFTLAPGSAGELRAHVIDSSDREFEDAAAGP